MPVAAASRSQSRRRVHFPTYKGSRTGTPDKESRTGTKRTTTAKASRLLNGTTKRPRSQQSRGTDHLENNAHPEHSAVKMAALTHRDKPFEIPAIFKEPPAIRDLLITESSRVQDAVVESCLPLLSGTDVSLSTSKLNRLGVPPLLEAEHANFFFDDLEDHPPGFVVLDASRPWMLYWALAGLTLLGEDLTSYRNRYGDQISTPSHSYTVCRNPNSTQEYVMA
jgi:protein farnesyltransferase subunit beta